MIVKRVNFDQYKEIALASNKTGVLVLEQQPYGTSEEQFFIVAVTEDFHAAHPDGTVIEDRGRTSGLFQCKGASGVLHPEMAQITVGGNAGRILAKCPNGYVQVEGESWQEILTNLSETSKIDVTGFLNAQIKTQSKSTKKKKNS